MLHFVCLVLGSSFIMISQYPHAIAIPNSVPTDFRIEDPLNSSGVSDSADNAMTLENTTGSAIGFCRLYD